MKLVSGVAFDASVFTELTTDAAGFTRWDICGYI
jgi:hypothetical protein